MRTTAAANARGVTIGIQTALRRLQETAPICRTTASGLLPALFGFLLAVAA
jgi:hypothetical protein